MRAFVVADDGFGAGGGAVAMGGCTGSGIEPAATAAAASANGPPDSSSSSFLRRISTRNRRAPPTLAMIQAKNGLVVSTNPSRALTPPPSPPPDPPEPLITPAPAAGDFVGRGSTAVSVGLGDAAADPVSDGLGDTTTAAFGVAVGFGVLLTLAGLAVALTGLGVGLGVALAGLGVGFGVAFAGFGVGLGVGLGVGFGVGTGVGTGVGAGVGVGVGTGVGVGVGGCADVDVDCQLTGRCRAIRHHPDSHAIAASLQLRRSCVGDAHREVARTRQIQ